MSPVMATALFAAPPAAVARPADAEVTAAQFEGLLQGMEARLMAHMQEEFGKLRKDLILGQRV